MLESLTNPAWVPIYGILISVLLAALTYVFQKYVDRKNSVQSLRRECYLRYFSAMATKMHMQTIGIKDDEKLEKDYVKLHLDALGDMRKSYHAILVISSDNVCRKAAAFHNFVSEDFSSRSSEKFSELYGDLLIAIRNEGFGKSRISKDEIEQIVNAKI